MLYFLHNVISEVKKMYPANLPLPSQHVRSQWYHMKVTYRSPERRYLTLSDITIVMLVKYVTKVSLLINLNKGQWKMSNTLKRRDLRLERCHGRNLRKFANFYFIKYLTWRWFKRVACDCTMLLRVIIANSRCHDFKAAEIRYDQAEFKKCGVMTANSWWPPFAKYRKNKRQAGRRKARCHDGQYYMETIREIMHK